MLDPSHSLATRNRSFSVLREDGSELIAIPNHRISRIEVGPGVDFSRKPIDLALEAGIEIALLDGYGQTKGTAMGGDDGRRAALQFAQAQAVSNATLRVGLARKLVEARIRNQRTQLMRLNRDRGIDPLGQILEEMKRTLRKLDGAGTVDELRGLEGSTTARYWPALGLLVRHDPPQPFRRGCPARDPVNAAINYMTAILERDIRAAIQSVGLHTGFAFLHGTRDRHDGLIFDLMEPFRAPLTEGLPVYLFNAHQLRPEMFTEGLERAVEISEKGRRAIVLGYEAAVAKRVNRPDGRGKLGWRAMMQYQARSLAQAISAAVPERFVPYVMEA